MKCIPLLLLLFSSCLCHPLKDSPLNVETCSGLKTFTDSLAYNFADGGPCNEAEPSDECDDGALEAAEEIVRNCLGQDGTNNHEQCFEGTISQLTADDRNCICGGISDIINMVRDVHHLLCNTTDSENREGNLFVPWSSSKSLKASASWSSSKNEKTTKAPTAAPTTAPTTAHTTAPTTAPTPKPTTPKPKPGPGATHPVILLPGDGGSRIEAKLDNPKDPKFCKKKSGWYDIWVSIEQLTAGLKCWKHNMELVYDPKTKTTSDQEGVSTRIPGTPPAGTTEDVEWLDPKLKGKTAYYAKMVKKLEELGYVTDVNLHGAPYDFRRAANEQDEYFKNLKKLIENTYKKNGKKPVIMIAHSMGCTMTLYFLTNKVNKAWKKKHVKSIITLAGPWGGSAKALEVFTVGTDLNERFPLLKPLEDKIKIAIRDVERTNPSLAWMMPTSQIWSKDPLVKTTVKKKEKDYTTADIGDFFKLLDVPNMAIMYKDVQSLTADLPDPEVKVYCVYGSGLTTTDQVIYAGDPKTTVPHFNKGFGDGTVNAKSLEACKDWKKVTTKDFPGEDHMDMVKGNKVLKYVVELVEDLNKETD